MTHEKSPIDEVRRYYNEKIRAHGATPQGVDWRDAESQEARFAQLALLIAKDLDASVADIGCGYGAFAFFLRTQGWRGHYEGVDVSEEMIDAAQKWLGRDPNFHLTFGATPSQPADFVVASGIFNVKGETSGSEWVRYIYATLDQMISLAKKGAAFNFLTSWSDAPFMRKDLFYAAPETIFAYCAERYSRWLEISQDYGLFEFTVRLRLDRRASRLRAEQLVSAKP